MKNKNLRYIIAAAFVIVASGISILLIAQKTSGQDSYVGLTESQARERASNKSEEFRIVRRDTESLPVTDDYRGTRVNFEIDGGKVTKVRRY